MAEWWDDMWGKEQTETVTENLEPRKAPEYEESKKARADWSTTLSEWGDQPGYGAIQPNWEDLWSNARGKVRQYYGGGPSGPGMVDRMKSDAARRNMGDQPGTSANIARLGMKEGQQVQDIAVEQAMKEAMLGEQGRQTWLGSLQSLAGQKPTLWNPGGTSTTTSGGGEGWDVLGAALGMAVSAGTGGMAGGGGGGAYGVPSATGAMDFGGAYGGYGGGSGGSGGGFGITGALGNADAYSFEALDPFFADQRPF